MSLLIRHARILTLATGDRPRRGPTLRELGLIEKGDVLVRDGVVAEVAPAIEAPPDTQIIEAGGRVLMPGFVDCHTHACFAGDRLAEWEMKESGMSHTKIIQNGGGIQATVRAVRDTTRKQLAAQLRTRLDAMLREGTTTVEVKSGYGLRVDDELNLLHAIQRAATDWPGTVKPTALLGHAAEGDPEEFARTVVRDVLPAVAKDFPGITVDAYCEKMGWSVEACVKLFEKARKHHPIRVHADQFSSLGMVTEALRLGARSIDHLEASTDDDLKAIADSHTYGVILPCAGFQINGRYARARKLIDAGGLLALATDFNPGTAPCSSMPFAIALAVRACRLTPAEAIAAATVNAASLLGLNDRGTIAPGQRADLLLLRHKDERSLAYEFGGNPVDLVVCGGKVVTHIEAAR
ncbi:MAG: imidazolonepropionase [Verrucomicrobia bacterium]|nr:imidazolonepropionase [Verrucomicrobiota bacterium]